MKMLVLVGHRDENVPMRQLLASAGVSNWRVISCFEFYDKKPSMKDIRQARHLFVSEVTSYQPDVIYAVGETAARMALDTSVVNINKLRGRYFEYVPETKTTKKKEAT